jgi:hypothetical protein
MMKCEDRPTLDVVIPAEEWNRGVPNGPEDIIAETSLIVRIAMMNNLQASEGVPSAEALRLTGLRQFLCPKCRRMHWEIDKLDPTAGDWKA